MITCTMWARRLTYKLMVAAPFVLMTSIAVNSRTYKDSWSSLEAGAELNERIGAYVDPVRAVVKLQWMGRNCTSDSEARDVATQWAGLAKSGVLKPLIPAYFGDSMENGVKQQILLANRSLTRRLESVVRNDLRDGRPLLAARDLALSLEVSSILKYSDLISLSTICTEQLRSIELLKEIAPLLDRQTSRKTASLIESYLGQKRQLIEMLVRSRNQFSVQAARDNEVDLAIVDPEPFVELTSLVQSHQPSEASMKSIRGMIMASRGDMPQVITLTRIAWVRQNSFDNMARGVITLLRQK